MAGFAGVGSGVAVGTAVAGGLGEGLEAAPPATVLFLQPGKWTASKSAKAANRVSINQVNGFNSERLKHKRFFLATPALWSMSPDVPA